MGEAEAGSLFGAEEWLRYSRHLRLPDFGAEGQTALKRARVLLVGCGGLASPVALYLAAAGVGQLELVDGDVVEVSNLQRQIAFSTADLGRSKALCLRDRLTGLNPHARVHARVEWFGEHNARALVAPADLVIDCSDNFATRYLLNAVCVAAARPWIYASIHQYAGQAALFVPGRSCFRCVFPEPPGDAPDCNAAGVLGVLPGLLGCVQASEAMAYLAHGTSPLADKLLLFDARTMSARSIALRRSPGCRTCGAPAGQLAVPEAAACSAPAAAVAGPSVLAESLARLDEPGAQLLDVRSSAERRAFHLGGLHIPLDELPLRLAELDRRAPLIVYCQSGARSREALVLLREAGFAAAGHLSGGIEALLATGHTLPQGH